MSLANTASHTKLSGPSDTERPLAIDLFTGLHGWSTGLVAEGWRVVGFDLEDMCALFGVARPDGVQLVLQDVLTLHGSQFKDAALIVASPPCQAFSYMAMPWTKAKQMAAEYRNGQRDVQQLTALFDACFRIQREAIEAAGHHIPLVVENVRGAQPWVGRSRWNYGSFHLWGDVPALMPIPHKAVKVPWFRFDGSGRSFQSAAVEQGQKTSGHVNQRNGHDHTQHLTNPDEHHQFIEPYSRFGVVDRRGRFIDPDSPVALVTEKQILEHIKLGGSWFHGYRKGQGPRNHGSKSPARKAASAAIARIPLPLAQHIARAWKP